MLFERRRGLVSNPFFPSSSLELDSAKKRETLKTYAKDKANAQSVLLPKYKAQGRGASLRAAQRCLSGLLSAAMVPH